MLSWKFLCFTASKNVVGHWCMVKFVTKIVIVCKWKRTFNSFMLSWWLFSKLKVHHEALQQSLIVKWIICLETCLAILKQYRGDNEYFLRRAKAIHFCVHNDKSAMLSIITFIHYLNLYIAPFQGRLHGGAPSPSGQIKPSQDERRVPEKGFQKVSGVPREGLSNRETYHQEGTVLTGGGVSKRNMVKTLFR